jgi:two-component system sensor histidine kinase RpfC
MRSLKSVELYENQEFQSAMVRLGIWGFAVVYVSAGALSERYHVDLGDFFFLFAVYLLSFIAILISVAIRPEWDERRYVSLAIDISATTFCIYLTGEGVSPFFLLFIWIFVSYGNRYGRQLLNIASILSVIAYSAVLTIMGQWGKYFFEASFILLALVFLPIYQHSLMRQLQNARSEAERSNRTVGRFLSNMTNEMRGPLVDILATTKELSSPELNAGQLDKVDDINSSASILDSVIGDVLDFYKLESKQLHLQSVPFNMHTLIAEVCLSVANPALVKKKELVCSIASGVPVIIVGDEQRLKQALTNIMRSAINCCLGDELEVSVRIDNSDLEMLLFEIRGKAPLTQNESLDFDDETIVRELSPEVDAQVDPDLGNSFANKLISLMGGCFWFGPREDGIIYRFSFPAKTDDFDIDQIYKLSSLQGKRAFILEPNRVSRDEIVRCCVEQDMRFETVNRVGELSDSVSELEGREDVDLVIIADSPEGRDIARIADVCLDVLGKDLPLVVLFYRRNCLDLSEYNSAFLLRKPFLRTQLAATMARALVRH